MTLLGRAMPAVHFSFSNASFVRAEVMGDFVPDCIFNELANPRWSSAKFFYRILKNGNSVGRNHAIVRSAVRLRHALIESQQNFIFTDAYFLAMFRPGIIFNKNNYIIHKFSKTFGNLSQGLINKLFKRLSGHYHIKDKMKNSRLTRIIAGPEAVFH